MKDHSFTMIRRAGVPLCMYETADPASTETDCYRALNGKANDTTALRWDIVRGLVGINPPGKDFVTGLTEEQRGAATGPTGVLTVIMDATAPQPGVTPEPIKMVLFYHNAPRFWDDTGTMQALWIARDVFKARGITLCMLGTIGKLPAELRQDCIVIAEDLPGPEAIDKIVLAIAADADITDKLPADRAHIVDTLLGCSGFGAEQVFAMSLTREGVDMDQLWQRKRKLIEQTPGLQVWRGGETFDDLGGLENLKAFYRDIMTSATSPVRCVVYLDELEKSLAGISGDMSGTSQDQLGVLLREMEDRKYTGTILIGPGGTGKSAIAKATGSLTNAPVIAMDLGAMKDSLVGGSEARIRAAMDVIAAISQGKALFVATCNKIAALPPEIRRRFTLGTFFVDLPSAEERAKIWQLWIKRYGLKKGQTIPEDNGWTGAEIRACCDGSFRTGKPLTTAASYIVPICKSAGDQIKALREMASGKFVSANRPGIYNMNEQTQEQPAQAGRRMTL